MHKPAIQNMNYSALKALSRDLERRISNGMTEETDRLERVEAEISRRDAASAGTKPRHQQRFA